MPLKIIRQDITKIECDAIVNPSNTRLYPGGGTDLSIHKAAGPELLKCCEQLGGCEVGQAKISPAFELPCKFVIHTVGPVWQENQKSEDLLVSCYKECLALAKEYNCETVAFPLISSGTYGFPKKSVMKIATSVISDFLFDNEMLVYLVVYDKKAFEISEKLFCDVAEYIDDNYVDENAVGRFGNYPKASCRYEIEEIESKRMMPEESVCLSQAMPCDPDDIGEWLKQMDKGFADTLFYYIDKKEIMFKLEPEKASQTIGFAYEKERKAQQKLTNNKPKETIGFKFDVNIAKNANIKLVVYKGQDLNDIVCTILNCLSHISEKRYFGATMLVDVLRGAKSKRIIDAQLDTIPEYKKLKSIDRESLNAIIEWLIDNHFILQTKGLYPVLHPTYDGLNYKDTMTSAKLKKLYDYLGENSEKTQMKD